MPKNKRLSEIGRRMLLQAKTDMLTAEIAHVSLFPDQDVEAVRSAIRRLCGQPPHYLHLKPEPLDARRCYYRLTPRGAKQLGVSPKYATPLKRLGRVKRYALAFFMHAQRPGERTYFNPRDFPEEFPLRGHRLPRHPFYLERSGEKLRIGVILVDHNAHIRRVVQKTLNPLGRFLRQGWFDSYIRNEQFVVAILTSTEYRKSEIRRHLVRAIQEHFGYPLLRLRPDLKDRLPLKLNVQIIPRLADVIAFEPLKEPDR